MPEQPVRLNRKAIVMRFMCLLPLILILSGCGRRETTLAQKIAGNWELTNKSGEITISADGGFLSQFTGRTQVWVFEGTWQVSDGVIVLTTTKSNSVPRRDVSLCRIIRADGHELIYELNGQTISLSRKQ